MSALRIVRFLDDGSAELRHNRLIRHRGAETVETNLSTPEELRAAVYHDLAMPRCPVEQAVAIHGRLTGRPFFAGPGDGFSD
jgi:hypothetical protein